MIIFGFAKYLALRLIQQPPVTGGPKSYAPNAGNVFFALFAAVGMVGAVGYGFNSVLRGPISAMTETTKRTLAESTVITTSRLAIVGATTQQADAGDTDNDGFIEPVPYRDAGTAPHPAGGGYLPTALNIPNTIDPWNTQYGYCAWDHGSVTASSRRLAGSPNNNRHAIAIISAGKDKRFQTRCVAYVDDTTNLIQRTPGSDDIVLAYTYAEANDLGNGLWKPHATAPNTATTDRNIDVTGSGLVSGGIVLSGNTATGGGLILPSDPGDDSISGACDATNDNQLRYNVSVPTEPPVIEICDDGGLGWSPVSGGAGGGATTGQLVLHYKFDEATGTTANDEGGVNDGTLANGPAWQPGLGRIGGAISFDGTDDRITVANGASLRPTAFTIAAWVNLPASQVNSNAKILTKEWQGHGGPVYTSYGWSISSGTDLVFETGHTDMTTHLYVGATLPANVWTHVVTLFDPAQTPPKRVYINGVLADSDSDATPLIYDSATNGDGDLLIGLSTGGSEAAAMRLDDLRIYNYGMTDEQVMQLYSFVNPSRLNLEAPMKAGAIFSWGADTNGKLGNGTAETTNRTAPGPIAGGNDFINVSAGWLHACGVKIDGTVWCWGYDLNGELGNGPVNTQQPSPVAVLDLSNIIKVAAGQRHSCALRNDGAIFCWGDNPNGQLGDGTDTDRNVPVRVQGIANAIDIATGRHASCAVVADGSAWCWGDGHLGNGAASTSFTPVQVSDVTDFVQISFSGENWEGAMCGVTKRGKAYCWGVDVIGRLGNGPGSTTALTPEEVTNTLDNFSKIVSYNATVCAIVAQNNQVACWGQGGSGQIGDGSGTSVNVPTFVSNITGVIDIAITRNAVCAVDREGSVWCWGADTYGELGDGEASSAQANRPVKAKIANAYKISASGDSFYALVDTTVQASAAPPQYAKKFSSASAPSLALPSCHIRSDGTMWCWGVEQAGELGNGGGLTDTAASPVQVTDPGPWMSVTTGTDITCGIKVDGTAWCWGDDANGQLGNGATAGSQASPSPVSVATPTAWTQLSAGEGAACGIKADGTAYCWGSDANGQLGNGGGGSSNIPGTAITSTLPWIQISQGGSVTCGIKSDNSLWCWGDASSGRLGNGTTTPNLQSPANTVPGTWRYIDATGPCGIKTDGSAWCWGSNTNSKLGIGSTYTGDQSVPRLVVEPGPWASIKAGGWNVSCGVKMDGTGWCWGDNDGPLGMGSAPGADVPYPVPVIGKDWAHIDGGGASMRCGLKNDDSVWCWGDDFLDVLGNGVGDSSSNYPQRIYQPYKSAFSAVDATSKPYGAAPAANLAIGGRSLTNIDGTVQGLNFPGSGRSLLTQPTTANQFGLETSGVGGVAQIWMNGNNMPYYMGYNAYTGGLEFGYGHDWLTAYTNGSLEIANDGFVGIGTGGAPVARLDVRGAVRMEDAGSLCNAAVTGTLKYVGGAHSYCNGSTWLPFGMAPASLLWDNTPGTAGASNNHRCGIKSNGTLWCGGQESSGELGNGGSANENTGANFVQIGTHTWKQATSRCAIRSDGTAWCWGEGSNGELGNNATSDSTVPVQVTNNSGGAGWSDWVSISSGSAGSCGIRSDGSAWCWGQVVAAPPNSYRPARVPDTSGGSYWTDWKQIDLGIWNACGIRSDGSAWCWGTEGDMGHNGNGEWNEYGTPQQVRNTTNTGAWYDWVSISSGDGSACGIRANGEAYCWGGHALFGTSGYPGDGTTNITNTPQKVHDTTTSTGFSDWVSLKTTSAVTCGVRATGQLYCWGMVDTWPPEPPRVRPVLVTADTDWLGVYELDDNGRFCFSRAGGRMFCSNHWDALLVTEAMP